MKFVILSIALAAGTALSANLVKRDISFTLNTPLGYISTDQNGYNTIGVSPAGPTRYSISGNTLSVQGGPECAVDSSANQRFQCYDFNGIVSTSIFSIADNDDLLYNDCPNFYACKLNLAGTSYSIYTDTALNVGNCTKINIQLAGFSGTAGGGSSASSAASSITATPTSIPLSTTLITVTPFLSAASTAVASTTPSAVASTVSGVTCPTDLSKGAIAPNLFVHVNPNNVNYTSGSSPNVTITPNDSTLLNFDVPTTYTDTCALLFMFPYSSSLNASDALNPYEFSGVEEEEGENGGLGFSLLDGIANKTTTYNTKPDISESYGTTQIIPGNSYTIHQFLCQWGETTYEIGSAGDVSLIYDQDVDNSPIGLFIVHCSGSSA